MIVLEISVFSHIIEDREEKESVLGKGEGMQKHLCDDTMCSYACVKLLTHHVPL